MIYKLDNENQITCHIDKKVCITNKCSAWVDIPDLGDLTEHPQRLKAIKEEQDLTEKQIGELNDLILKYEERGYCGLVNHNTRYFIEEDDKFLNFHLNSMITSTRTKKYVETLVKANKDKKEPIWVRKDKLK